MKVDDNSRVLEMTRLASGAWSMLLETDGLAGQVSGPGQFVHVKCGHSRLLRRPISICSWSPDQDWIRLVFEVRGEGTEWLSRRTAGDRLNVLGPLGHGFQMNPQGRYLLVGGGIGVPPMLGCAQWTGGRSTAILGFRAADKVMLEADFQTCCAQVQVATDDGSYGYHGFVDALVRKTLEQDQDFTGVLACGPKPMLRSVALAAEAFGVACQVSMEERMGCGVGACLVCACKTRVGQYRHACKVGPVFDAGEVEWDA